MLEDSATATRQQLSNATVMDGVKVMDVATATAMDIFLATLRRWTGYSNECCDGNGDGNGWLIGNAMAMNGPSAAQW